jgi:hypothetical protein
MCVGEENMHLITIHDCMTDCSEISCRESKNRIV